MGEDNKLDEHQELIKRNIDHNAKIDDICGVCVFETSKPGKQHKKQAAQRYIQGTTKQQQQQQQYQKTGLEQHQQLLYKSTEAAKATVATSTTKEM